MPEMEDEIVNIITKTPTEKEFKFGKELLKKYNYSTHINYNSNILLKNYINNFQRDNVICITILFLIIILFISFDFKNIYLSFRKFSDSIQKIIDGNYNLSLPNSRDGNYNLSLPNSRDGEISILGHNINQLSYRLKSTINDLQKDKNFLKNIVSDISHQLKTPLTSLIIMNEILTNNHEMKLNNRLDFLEKTKNQLERMEWLVVSLLKYARIEAKTIVFKKEKVDFLELIESILNSLDFLIKEKNIKIDIDTVENIPYLECDNAWLKEALINIVKNAIEHSYENSKINIKFESNSLFKRIYIKDFGDGIAQKDIPYIFDRFKKINNKLKPNSIGIGLSLSKAIINGIDGEIYVNSELNKETCFVITFSNSN
ncbi:MAG: HAMP domain-containing sensor histidine kinase [Clostridiales bacterium]